VGRGLLEYSQPVATASMASLVRLRVVSLYMRQTQELTLEASTSYWEHVEPAHTNEVQCHELCLRRFLFGIYK
jgi:hypothetical protein